MEAVHLDQGGLCSQAGQECSPQRRLARSWGTRDTQESALSRRGEMSGAVDEFVEGGGDRRWHGHGLWPLYRRAEISSKVVADSSVR